MRLNYCILRTRMRRGEGVLGYTKIPSNYLHFVRPHSRIPLPQLRCIYMYIHVLHIHTHTMSASNHVVPKTECATLYSCFRLVSHHQQGQGIAYSAHGTTGFYRTRCTGAVAVSELMSSSTTTTRIPTTKLKCIYMFY